MGLGNKVTKRTDAKYYLLKVNKDVWEKFVELNRNAGYGISMNQRINFWIESANKKTLGKDFEKGRVSMSKTKTHTFTIEIFNELHYESFNTMCKESGLSFNKAINLFIRRFNDFGYVCKCKPFYV